MARTVRNAKIDTRTARNKLPAGDEIHWVSVSQGKAIGYRKGPKGGSWISKIATSALRKQITLGAADDTLDANGTTILSYAQAQDKARTWWGEMEAGPAAPVVIITVEEAVRRYVAFLAAEKKTAKDAEQRLTKHVLPVLGKRRVVDLTLTELENWRNALVCHDDDDPDVERRSKDTANRLINYLKAALNRLMQDQANGITDDRAWRFFKPFRDVGQARQVHLDRDQITRLINVTSGGLRRLVTASLLTGCRFGEMEAMRISSFSPSTGTIHVPDEPGCKTGARDVVLTLEGVAFFNEITAGHHPDMIMFPRDDGKPWGKSGYTRPLAAAVKLAKLPEDTCHYSLRHTYASQSLMAGMNVQLLAENMGTSVAMIEKHYGKFTKSARRAQIEASAPKLGLGLGNVTALAVKKGRKPKRSQ